MAFRRHVWADRVNELAKPLLASLASEERLFVWLHYTDPHAPYLLQPGTENPFLDDEYYTSDQIVDLTGAEGRALGDQRELRYYVAQYDAERPGDRPGRSAASWTRSPHSGWKTAASSS